MTANLKLHDWVTGLCREHDSAIKAIVRRHARGGQDVSDLSQDVYLRLLQYVKEPSEIKNVLGYINEIARNLIKSQARRGRIPTVSLDAESNEHLLDQIAAAAELTDQFILSEKSVGRAFSKLPRRFQAVVELAASGLSDEQIADGLNLSPTTVYSYRLRARGLMIESCIADPQCANGNRSRKVNGNGN